MFMIFQVIQETQNLKRVKIEDDIAIGQDNYVILTVEAAKEIADIEAIAEYGVTTPMDDEVTDIYSL
ncbi:unnamed protein product [[Candida] boidinii]|nr:unnamed protein product [[Candida] boidinii]